MQVMFYKLLMIITIAVLRLCDIIFNLFNYLAGIDKVMITGRETDLVEFFVKNPNITTIFGWICCIGVVIGAIFTIISLIKSMIINGKKSQNKIFIQYFSSIISMIFAFSILLMGIWAVSLVLQMVNMSFTLNAPNETIGSNIMSALVGEKIDIHEIVDGKEIGVAELTNKILGIYKGTWPLEGLWEDINNILIKPGLIDIRAFPYFIALLSAGVLCWTSFSAVLGLIVRLYDIAFLTLVMPLPLAAYPLDDGARFKLWRETMISKMMLAFGTIFAVNIYIIMVGEVNKIELPGAKPFVSQLFRVLLIVCGGFTISAGQLLFARIMGTDAQESRQMQHNFRNALGGIGTSMGLAKSAHKMIFGSKPKPGSGSGSNTNQTSNTSIGGAIGRRGGAIGTIAKIGGAAGRILGGNRYKASAGKAFDNMKAKMGASKENFMNNGGILGKIKHTGEDLGIKMTTKKGSIERSMKEWSLERERNEKNQKRLSYIKQRENKEEK